MRVKEVLSWVLWVGMALLVALLLRGFVFDPITVEGSSMIPTLNDGQYMLIEKISKHTGGIGRGDVVVIHLENLPPYVKRVVAVGGDTVEVKDGALYVNGQRQDESYLNELEIRYTMEEQLIPEGYYFVMGDNRNNSSDSHSFGPVPLSQIMGKKLF